MNKGKQKGITLIALIITIIVMLILVAVTVNVALDGSLFGKTKEAVDKTNEKVGKLQQDVDYYTDKLNEVLDRENEPTEEGEWTFVESFTSPYYPGNYPNNANEVITRDYGSDVTAIKIVIKDIQLENGCNYDFLQFFNGPYISSPIIARVCNGALGTRIIHSNVFTFRFISDGSVTRRGYSFDVYTTTDADFLGSEEGWTAQESQPEPEPDPEPPETEEETDPSEPTEKEDENISSEPTEEEANWIFVESCTSPNYPGNYPNDVNEVITKDYGSDVTAIKIVMKDVQLESGCNYDYLQIFDGPYVSSPQIARICNGGSGTYVIRKNTFTYRFVSDNSVVRKGFEFEVYTSTYKGFLN